MKPNQSMIDMWTRAADAYHEAMPGSPAEDYLRKRGLSGDSTVQTWVRRCRCSWSRRKIPWHPVDSLLHSQRRCCLQVQEAGFG